jgi:hypothetical protein
MLWRVAEGADVGGNSIPDHHRVEGPRDADSAVASSFPAERGYEAVGVEADERRGGSAKVGEPRTTKSRGFRRSRGARAAVRPISALAPARSWPARAPSGSRKSVRVEGWATERAVEADAAPAREERR